jgi:hypothetical protein
MVQMSQELWLNAWLGYLEKPNQGAAAVRRSGVQLRYRCKRGELYFEKGIPVPLDKYPARPDNRYFPHLNDELSRLAKSITRSTTVAAASSKVLGLL